jgi:hypothetical protein
MRDAGDHEEAVRLAQVADERPDRAAPLVAAH